MLADHSSTFYRLFNHRTLSLAFDIRTRSAWVEEVITRVSTTIITVHLLCYFFFVSHELQYAQAINAEQDRKEKKCR